MANTVPIQSSPSAITRNPSPSFSTLPSLLEHTHHQSKKQPTDGVSGVQSSQQPTTSVATNGSSLPLNLSASATISSGIDTHSKPVTVLSVAAASSSGYYQMPSSLQDGADMFGSLTSSFTPTDSIDSSFSSLDPSLLGIGGKNPGPTSSPSNSASTSLESDYFQAPNTSNPSGINTGFGSSGENNSFFAGGGTGCVQSQGSSVSSFPTSSSYLPSSASYTAGGGGGNNEGFRPKMGGDDAFCGDLSSLDKTSMMFSSTSSMSSTFSPPSISFHSSSQGLQGKTTTEADPDFTSDGYLPGPNTYALPQDLSHITDSMPFNESWGDTTFATTSIANASNSNNASGVQTKATSSSTNANTGSTHINFPVSFGDDEDGDFDDFDLPPLPDSLDPLDPSSSSPLNRPGGGNGHSGYGGSIVTLGNPTN